MQWVHKSCVCVCSLSSLHQTHKIVTEPWNCHRTQVLRDCARHRCPRVMHAAHFPGTGAVPGRVGQSQCMHFCICPT